MEVFKDFPVLWKEAVLGFFRLPLLNTAARSLGGISIALMAIEAFKDVRCQ